MRSYNQRKKNNIIIGTLCAIVLLITVGYAAFSSVLNIKGISSINSNWNIEITNIRGGNPEGGDAYDISDPTYTPTTATFATGLKTPGTNRVYEVEVTNKGTLTGLVTIANLSCGDNGAIWCSPAAFNEKYFDENWNYTQKQPNIIFNEGKQDYSDIAFTIVPGEKHYIYVDVYYEDVESQPDNLSTNINLELNYEQAIEDKNGNITPNRNLTASLTAGENVIGIDKAEVSCYPSLNNDTGEKECTITLPKIEANVGYGVMWYDKAGELIGYPGDKYTLTQDVTLTAVAHKFNIGTQVRVKGLDCGFNILSIDNDKARLFGQCLVNDGYSYNSSSDGDIPVAFEDSMLYQGLMDGTRDWKENIEAAGGKTDIFLVDAPTIEELAEVGKLRKDESIYGIEYVKTKETPNWIFSNDYITKSLNQDGTEVYITNPNGVRWFETRTPAQTGTYGGGVRPVLETSLDNLLVNL